MGSADITPRKRSKIVTLSTYTTKNIREIAKECKCLKSAVANIQKQYRETGDFSVKRKNICGRKRKTCC